MGIIRGGGDCKLNIYRRLKGDGDFRSEECIKILEQADIVVTNPPFSLFREYVAQLIKHKKKFLIIGNINAVSYKEVFPLIKNNKLWLGYKTGGMSFKSPSIKSSADNAGYDKKTGLVKLGNVVWFTNLKHKKRNEEFFMTKPYDPKLYLEYDNYDAINVDKVVDIPNNYVGVMGVPVSFLDKFNPEQFEIVGTDFEVKDGLLPHLVKPKWDGKLDRGYINGKRMYARIFIKHKNPEGRKS